VENKLRKYIINILLEEFALEANLSGHYKARADSRIKNSIPIKADYDENVKIPYSISVKVADIVEMIKKINFPQYESYAIKLLNLPMPYKHLDLDRNGQTQTDRNTGRVKESRGNSIWVLIRENTVKTIFLRFSYQDDNIPDIQYYIKSVVKLEDFFNASPKNQDGSIDFQMSKFKYSLQQSKENEDTLPKVKISSGVWFIDKENETLFQKQKKGNKVFNKIEKYEDKLGEEDLYKVWGALESSLVAETYFE